MIRTIKAKELKRMMDTGASFVLVDALNESSYEKEHIPGSISIPATEITERAPELINKNETVVVYCAGTECTASKNAAERLEELGYERVFRFEGGLEEWSKAGYGLEGSSVRKAA